MALPEVKPEDFSIPGMTGRQVQGFDASKYSVKYFKADLEDLGDLTMLQEIETKGIRGDKVLILNRDKFTFMDKYFVIVQYMEKNE